MGCFSNNKCTIINNIININIIINYQQLKLYKILRCSAVLLYSAMGPGQLFTVAPVGTVAQAIDFHVV